MNDLTPIPHKCIGIRHRKESEVTTQAWDILERVLQ